jgi:hypothetical protein
VTVSLYEGEGVDGGLLHSASRTVAAPFMGFLDVDYAAAGVVLVPGRTYTIVVSDDGPAAYPQGVSGWVVSSVTNPDAGQPVTDERGAVVGYLPHGAYPEGHPILQGMLYASDAGIGDNAFHVVDADAALAPLTIVTTALPAGRVGVAYATAVESAGGLAPVMIEITGLPAGLGFDGARITGRPEVPGTFGLMITATDSLGTSVAASASLIIDPAPSSSMVRNEGKGRITAVGPGYIKVGARTIKYDSTTILKLNYAPSIEVGMVAQWKGFKQPRTSVVFATKLEIR